MDDHDPLVDRLRDLGRRPVDPSTSAHHLSAMATTGRRHGRLRSRLTVGAAFGAGLLLGGTGLASAGALPGPAQDAAHKALSTVGVKVPEGTQRFTDPAVCGTDPATQQPFRNHGQYVKAHKGDPAAAQSRCGKPLNAGTEADEKPPGTSADPTTAPANGGSGIGGGGGAPNNGNGNSQGKGNGKPGKGNNKAGGADSKGTDETTDPAKGATPAAPGPSDQHGPATTAAPTPTSTSSSTSTSTVSPRRR